MTRPLRRLCVVIATFSLAIFPAAAGAQQSDAQPEETAVSPDTGADQDAEPTPDTVPDTTDSTDTVPSEEAAPEAASQSNTEVSSPEESQPPAESTPEDEPLPAVTEAVPPPAPDELMTDSGRRRYGRKGPRRMMLLVGPGFGLSFFGCSEINDYIEEWIHDQNAYGADQSSSKMILAFQPRFSLTFAPIEYVQIQFLGELAWAPKVIKVMGGTSESFHYLRYSAGATVSGHIPLAQGRRSLSFGAGVLFNTLKFESYKEYAPGYRGVMAFRFYGRKAFAPEIFVEFNWTKADTGADPDRDIPELVGELNYVSGTIGANFYFKVFEKR